MADILKGMVGLEIHAYPITKEKLFCTCKASREKGQKLNSFICPICTGQPGAKPMLPNKRAVERAVQIGLMLGCKINSSLRWQRKHYDWPDLPKGYQNTISGAYAIPVGVNGKFLGIRIRDMHLEEDPAAWDPKSGCVDYNRSGLPLVEIITDPDFSTSEEVVLWLRKLVHALSYLKAIDSNAGIKVDVNVNIPATKGSRSPISKGTERVEIKNINSIENIGKAIDYELRRQMKEGSERETRRFDEVKGKTIRMRGKEEAEDYRFISDPDLIDIGLDKKFVSSLEKSLPESPDEKLAKMIKKYKVDKYNAEILSKNVDIAEFFESVAEKIDAKFALHWVTGELLRHLNYHRKGLDAVNISVEHFVSLLKMVKSGKITELQGKQILNKFYPKSFDPSKQVKGRISDKSELRKIAEKVIAKNKKAVADYKAGEQRAFNFLMGQIMKETDRRADFKIAGEVLRGLLK